MGLTDEALAAFEAGDQTALHLGPWMLSPLAVDGSTPPAWAGQSVWADSWCEVWALRQALANSMSEAHRNRVRRPFAYVMIAGRFCIGKRDAASFLPLLI